MLFLIIVSSVYHTIHYIDRVFSIFARGSGVFFSDTFELNLIDFEVTQYSNDTYWVTIISDDDRSLY